MPEYIERESLISEIQDYSARRIDNDAIAKMGYEFVKEMGSIQRIIEKAPAADVVEVKKFADELCSKFAGHSDYHGDTILSTIRCIAEGKKVDNARPLKYKKYDNNGQWTEKRSRLGATLPIYACSVCGRAFTFRPGYDFCPGCGADMREGAEK